MERPDYPSLHKLPEGHEKPPEDHELRTSVEHPNLNSLQYRKKPINRTPQILPFYDRLALNSENVAILGSNNLRTRVWDGYVWGFPNLNLLGTEKNACFKIHANAGITNLQFMTDTMFIVAQANGTLQIWSTKADIPDIKEYCLFMLCEKCEHTGAVFGLDVLNSEKTNLVTGCADGTLRVWHVNTMSLTSLHCMLNAHSDQITGISANPSQEFQFATCSRDKTALLWDYRQTRPASILYDDNAFDLMTIKWHNDNLIYLGDEAGKVFVVDPKMPNIYLHRFQAFNRPIRKIEFADKQMAVIGNTNTVKVLELNDSGYDCVYENSKSKNIIRDVVWTSDNEDKKPQIFTIGWGRHKFKHNII